MNFALTQEQEAIKADIRHFALNELPQTLQAQDQQGEFSREAFLACGAKGILGANVAKLYGGGGHDALTTVIMLEALGYGSRDNGLTLAVAGQIVSIIEPILTYGSEEQKEKYLPRLISGEWVGSDGITEEASGSDALSLKTRAEKKGNSYVLNGTKCFVGMAPECDVALVLANSNPEMGKWGVSAFLVEKGTLGFCVSESREKMGTRTNPIGDLVFENCEISEKQMLGTEGIGVSLMTRNIEWERIGIHAGHLGSMDRVLERTVQFAKERLQFDQPIGKFHNIAHRIAEMRVRLETARLLMYQAAWIRDEDGDCQMHSAMAKLHVAESLVESSMDAIRIHGARGYLTEFEIERELRDHVGGLIYGGTSDIQKNLIASALGL